MPFHDYSCDACNFTLWDHYSPLVSSPVPECPQAGCEEEKDGKKRQLTRLWTTNRMHRTFSPFEFTMDDGEKRNVSCVEDLRRIERDSEKLHKEGKGRPFVFRMYSQDPANRQDGVFRHLQPKQIDPYTAKTLAGKMDFGLVTEGSEPEFHPATARAMEAREKRQGKKWF